MVDVTRDWARRNRGKRISDWWDKIGCCVPYSAWVGTLFIESDFGKAVFGEEVSDNWLVKSMGGGGV